MENGPVASQETILRTDLRPGDIGEIIRLHGTIYAAEHGFDPTFEAYVAGPLAEFVKRRGDHDCLWIAEHSDRIVGCVAIVGASETEAQLRWFLVATSHRGQGLGSRLLDSAVGFCQGCGYTSVFLWTVSTLIGATRLYARAGFQCVERRAGRLWGRDLVEEKYALALES